MPKTLETHFRVRSYELDMLGHVNHAVYVNYLEQARIEALESVGLPWNDLARRGLLFNVVHIEIDYRREARLGDTLRVTTTVEELGKTSITLAQRVFKATDGEKAGAAEGGGTTAEAAGPAASSTTAGADPTSHPVVAEARIVGVLVGQDGRPIPLPDEIREALS